jgi:glucose-1-phosphate cytidylyltransferase
MKIIILAGGLGTRISEETINKPKPMVLIGEKPIIWHLMNIFALQNFHDFIVATGYKGEVIKSWLSNDFVSVGQQDKVLDENVNQSAASQTSRWGITAIDTGLETQTAHRIAQCMKTIPGERVLVTYGDGLANVNIDNLLKFHKSHGKLATITAVRPPARFGYMKIEGDKVIHFGEKNQADEGWINGGFFILEPEVLEFIGDSTEPFESKVLPRLVENNQLMAYHHYGFWQPMDTLREKEDLVRMSKSTPPPWIDFA